MTNAPASTKSALLDPVPTPPLPGLVSAFLFRPGSAPEELPVDRPLPHRPDGWLWLHFNLADARSCPFLRTIPDFPARAIEVLIASGEHQQLHVADDCLYGVLADLVRGLDGVTEDLGQLHFALTEKMLITGRRRNLSGIESPSAIPPRSTASRRGSSPTKLTKAGPLLAACGGTACVCTGKLPFCVP
jgi:zinc transporter